jgi:phenylacetaldehyde dehydrogenase
MSMFADLDFTQLEGTGEQLMIINGERLAAMSGEMTSVIDPSTGRWIGSSPAADKADVDLAVAAARRSFDSGIWRNKSAADKQNILWRASDIMERHAAELAKLEALNSGMLLSMAQGTIAGSVQAIRYYAGMATKIYGQTTEVSGEHGQFLAYTLREPLGVAALIIPWNVPVLLTVIKVAAALAAGCSCIIKPSEETPLTALRLADFFAEAGVPKGVINVVTGYGHTAGAALSEHDGVDKVAFTGSGHVGKLIVRAASGNLKKVTLELGGKSPVIMFDDCDIDRAIQGTADGIFTHCGQICVSGSRLYVQRTLFDRAAEGLAAIAGNLKVGHCFAEGTQIGPLISQKQRTRVMGLIASGIEQGGELITGGKAFDGPGFYVSPTIIANPHLDSRVLKEEIFGPVLTMMAFDDIDDVVFHANNTTYGLASSVWTDDVNKAHLLAKRIQAGFVWINCHAMADISLPGGGYKQSGWGREQGLEGLDGYLQTKTVYAALRQ